MAHTIMIKNYNVNGSNLYITPSKYIAECIRVKQELKELIEIKEKIYYNIKNNNNKK